MKHHGIAALGIVGALAFAATSASAAIVCNDNGDCWHVKEKYEYKPEFGLHVYGDDWKWTSGGSINKVVRRVRSRVSKNKRRLSRPFLSA